MEKTTDLIGALLRIGLEASRAGPVSPVNRETLRWPEYVLWPEHPLASMGYYIPDSIFDFD